MENDLLSQVIHAMEGEEVHTDRVISSPSGPGTRERRSWGIERWIRRATQTGIIKAVELLALIDYHLFFANTEVDESAAIDHWGSVIRDAAITGKLTPLNQHSYLPVTTVPEGWDWMIRVSDADRLLEEMGFDFSCEIHLEHYKEEVFPTALPQQQDLGAIPQACKMPDVHGYDTPNELNVLFDHAVTAGIRMESQDQEPTVGQKETPQGPANKKQAGIVEETLCECESRAAKTNEHFDRKNMPGQKIQFLELLQKLEPSFKGMTSTQSLDRYTKGRCKWSLRAKSNASATPLYQKLFPEAWGNPGAVSKDSSAS